MQVPRDSAPAVWGVQGLQSEAVSGDSGAGGCDHPLGGAGFGRGLCCLLSGFHASREDRDT